MVSNFFINMLQLLYKIISPPFFFFDISHRCDILDIVAKVYCFHLCCVSVKHNISLFPNKLSSFIVFTLVKP